MDATNGKVCKTLIDGGMGAVMGGHILMPEYMKELHPDITIDNDALKKAAEEVSDPDHGG